MSIERKADWQHSLSISMWYAGDVTRMLFKGQKLSYLLSLQNNYFNFQISKYKNNQMFHINIFQNESLSSKGEIYNVTAKIQ